MTEKSDLAIFLQILVKNYEICKILAKIVSSFKFVADNFLSRKIFCILCKSFLTSRRHCVSCKNLKILLNEIFYLQQTYKILYFFARSCKTFAKILNCLTRFWKNFVGILWNEFFVSSTEVIILLLILIDGHGQFGMRCTVFPIWKYIKVKRLKSN